MWVNRSLVPWSLCQESLCQESLGLGSLGRGSLGLGPLVAGPLVAGPLVRVPWSGSPGLEPGASRRASGFQGSIVAIFVGAKICESANARPQRGATEMSEQGLKDVIQQKYGEAAVRARDGGEKAGCCGTSCGCGDLRRPGRPRVPHRDGHRRGRDGAGRGRQVRERFHTSHETVVRSP